MARPRSKRTEGLPNFVYLNKGRYFYRPPSGGGETMLAPATARRADVWEAFNRIIGPTRAQEPLDRNSLKHLCDQYRESDQFRRLAPRTRSDIETCFASALSMDTDDGDFGEVDVHDITVGTMRRFMDIRGQTAPVRANRELAYLSAMFTWAYERERVPLNPCKGVKRYPEQPRTRYVTDDEYRQRYDLAGAAGRQDIQVMMELAYLCRLRKNEIVRMLDSPVFVSGSNGVLASRGKGSKSQWIAWTPRLDAAIRLARSIERRMPTTCLLVSSTTGRPLTLRGFDGAWNALLHEARDSGHENDWHFHDLKAKGVSDFDGDKHKASGHKTQRMTAVYDRKLETVNPTR